MNSEVREHILSHNPWFEKPLLFHDVAGKYRPKNFIGRALDLSDFENPERVKLIVGPRQAGKSTFAWNYLTGIQSGKVLYLNGEDTVISSWTDSPVVMARDITREFPDVGVLFIDEIQHFKRAGITLKGFVDAGTNINVIATGSSTYHLDDRVRESLAGRAERRVLMPFSAGEILSSDASSVPAVARTRIDDAIRRMMTIGSYPGIWTAEDPRRGLLALVDAFVIRDVSDRFRIDRPEAFRRLLQLLAGQTGQMVNFSEYAAHLGISAPTVRQYVSLLEETWIVKLLPAFADGKRREVTSAARVHFYDLGLRNALLGQWTDDLERRPDKGALLEGLVFAELVKNLPPMWTIHYWRAKGGAEVDFVLRYGDRLVGLEVKSGARTVLTRSAKSFIEAYSPEIFLVVGMDEMGPVTGSLGKTKTIFAGVGELARLGMYNEIFS